jgi:hypothetical protein
MGSILSRVRNLAEDIMVRWIIAACSIALIGALSINASEAAKATKKKAEKVEYLRAAGSEPPPAPVKQVKKSKKATE